ncbi:hypothetical protein MSAN_00579300 [Mycena sanguinolenta]|uniref:Uncharacterized protein n=1 Tax=Mycena sanguinolenta TaxID=230812 RepID=A0A8H6Z6X8_9AGAR|nr:hypothetical protein MSAN_00579300 [Mycena sanguinolenta]
MISSSSCKVLAERFGFVIAPLTPPHIPDVILCRVQAPTLVNIVGALNSDVTKVSARNLSRWLFLLARHSARARPIRPPAVFRPISVVAGDVFVRFIDKVGLETFPCNSPDPLPPGCYALFDANGDPYPYPFGYTAPRITFSRTHRARDVGDDDPRASYRMTSPVPEELASQARERDRGLCCFTGRPSECITWVIPPLLSRWVTVPYPGWPLERCLSVDNVFTISSDLLGAYHDNRITADPQDGYRIVLFDDFPNTLTHLGSAPSSGRFWHSSLSWTLAVRFPGCDARFDGVSANKARDLLEEFSLGSSHTLPQSSERPNLVAQEAMRTFLWKRLNTQAALAMWESEDAQLSPSHSSTLNSSEGFEIVPDAAELHSDRHQSFIWFFFHKWCILVHYIWTLVCGPRRRALD